MKIWDYVMTELHNANVFEKNIDGTYSYDTDRNGNKIPKIYSDVMDPGVFTAQFCADCGKLASDNCTHVFTRTGTADRTMTGYFTIDNMPTELCDCHVNVRYCRSSGMIAGEDCPGTDVINRVITVSELCRNRYSYEDRSVYVYISDENYVFYDNGDGTYGGYNNSYSTPCTKHHQAVEQPAAVPPAADTPTSGQDERARHRKKH